MPPKRKRQNLQPTHTLSTSNAEDNKKSDSAITDNEAPHTKKFKTDPIASEHELAPQTTSTNNKTINEMNDANKLKPDVTDEAPNSDEEDDGRPVCWYDANCYRQNPVHFQQFRHPKKKALERKGLKSLTLADPQKHFQTQTHSATKGSSAALDNENVVSATNQTQENKPKLKRSGSIHLSSADLTKTVRPELLGYKSMLKIYLSGQKIGADAKRILRQYRQEHGVTDTEHNQFLGLFGWTPEEYEDGEKVIDDIDLDEEKTILADPNGFKIITLYNNQKFNKQEESAWARASAKFFQTMSKAQANYIIKSIGIIVNTKLKECFKQKKQSFIQKYGDSKDKSLVEETWGFHGTSEYSIQRIAKEGFKHPDELKTKTVSKKKSKNKVELLDEGYFGKGIYFSLYSDYAMWYSEERESSQILMCKLLTGKSYQCTGRMDGQGRVVGYDSHYSPKGNEIIVFESSQILPRYIITFEEKEAAEREQED
jgi:hypothetical protein